MTWLKKSEYHAEQHDNPDDTICWGDSKTAWWLFIAGQPITGTFSSKEEVKAEYERQRL